MTLNNWIQELTEIHASVGMPVQRIPHYSSMEVEKVLLTAGLPADPLLCAFYAWSDGSGEQIWGMVPHSDSGICNLKIFSLKEALGWFTDRTFNKHVLDFSTNDTRIQCGHADQLWFPFAESLGLQLVSLVDYSPGQTGSAGQVLRYEHDPDVIRYQSDTLIEYFDLTIRTLRTNSDRLKTIYFPDDTTHPRNYLPKDLLIAIEMNDLSVFRRIVNTKSKSTKRYGPRSLYGICNHYFRPLLAEYLISELNFPKDWALRESVVFGYVAAIESLVKNGCDVNKNYCEGKTTLLMLAAEAGNIEVVRKLLDLGANKSMKDDQGRTAEVYALWANDTVRSTLVDLLRV